LQANESITVFLHCWSFFLLLSWKLFLLWNCWCMYCYWYVGSKIQTLHLH